MVYIGADSKAFEHILYVKEWLEEKNIPFRQLGAMNAKNVVDITDFISELCEKVREDSENRGVMMCGTGIGVSIGANRFKGIRAVLANDSELAEWSKIYDNSNVLCMSSWRVAKGRVFEILDAWINTDFEDKGGRRIARLAEMDDWK